MKGRIVQGLLVGALCVTAIRVWSDLEMDMKPDSQQIQVQDATELEQQLSVRELLHCKSLVPETENSFVHIGGGFFAYFNRRVGMVEKSPTLSSPDLNRRAKEKGVGEIRFSLQELGYESRLVYRPTGSLALKTVEGRTLNFSMKLLDYVQVSGQELPCYRLTASSDAGDYFKAILICRAVGTETPVLVGTLYLLSDSGRSICVYQIEIRGRNSVEAENHLLKVVEVASHF